jgi:hypothetical protein
MIAWTSPLGTVNEMPLRISVPSSAIFTCRFLISSMSTSLRSEWIASARSRCIFLSRELPSGGKLLVARRQRHALPLSRHATTAEVTVAGANSWSPKGSFGGASARLERPGSANREDQ